MFTILGNTLELVQWTVGDIKMKLWVILINSNFTVYQNTELRNIQCIVVVMHSLLSFSKLTSAVDTKRINCLDASNWSMVELNSALPKDETNWHTVGLNAQPCDHEACILSNQQLYFFTTNVIKHYHKKITLCRNNREVQI